MSTERWRDRVQKAWRDIDEARRWRQQVDDNDAEERAARPGRDYADFESEQHRRTETEPGGSAVNGLWAAIRHPIDTIDRKITEAQTCPGCGCKPHEWRADCDCLRQGCVCAGADQDDNPDWEREPGPDAAIVDAAGRNDGLPPAAKPYEPQRKRPLPEPPKTTPPTTRTTTGSPGGTGMSITDARGAIMSGHQSAEQALNELMGAHRSLEDSQNSLMQGTEGSNQAEADQAHAQLTEALNKIDEARQQVASALQEFENVAQRL